MGAELTRRHVVVIGGLRLAAAVPLSLLAARGRRPGDGGRRRGGRPERGHGKRGGDGRGGRSRGCDVWVEGTFC